MTSRLAAIELLIQRPQNKSDSMSLRRLTTSQELPTQDVQERHQDFSTHHVGLPSFRLRPRVINTIILLLLALPVSYLLRQNIKVVLQLLAVLAWEILHSPISSLAELSHAFIDRLHSDFCAKRDEFHIVCQHLSNGRHDHAREPILLLMMLLIVLLCLLILLLRCQRKKGDEESDSWMQTPTNKIWWTSYARGERRKLK